MTQALQALQSFQDFPWAAVIVFIGMGMLQWRVIGALDAALARSQTPDAPLPPHAIPPPAPVPVPAVPPVVHPAPAVPPAPVPAKPATEYDRMWAAMQILPQHQAVIEHDAGKIMAEKVQYEAVSQQCGVPWYVIGLIDVMEAGGGCKAHLHNGDPLGGRTIHVPSGRPPAPAAPPFTWAQSALDAMQYEGFDKIKTWPLATIAGQLEKYNGLGYHARGVPSPYLWSFSNQYRAGKFVADHVYDPNAVSEQAGAMTILKALTALDPSINF